MKCVCVCLSAIHPLFKVATSLALNVYFAIVSCSCGACSISIFFIHFIFSVNHFVVGVVVVCCCCRVCRCCAQHC